MYYTVYKTINHTNNYEYIGVHKSKKLKYNYMGSGSDIKKAFKEFGKENFSKEIIFMAVSEDIAYWIENMLVDKEYTQRFNTYNINEGGSGGGKGRPKGTVPWNKGLKGVQVAWNKGISDKKSKAFANKVSNTLKEKYKKEDHHSKGKPAWNKGIKSKKFECPYCNRFFDAGNYGQWHGEKCKHK